jgi:hypothetical protein
MKKLKAFLLAMPLILVGCVSNIHTETRPIDNPGDIKGARTYHWIESGLSLVAPTEVPSSTFSDAIKQAVDESLQQLGYQKVSAERAEFAIDATLTISREESQRIKTNLRYDQEDYLQYGLRWRLAPNTSVFKPDPAFPKVEISVYERGTLHIGAFDKVGNIAWHGEAHKIIEKHHSPDEHRNVMQKATKQLMLRFPEAK